MPTKTKAAPEAPKQSRLETIYAGVLGRLKGGEQRQIVKFVIAIDMDKWMENTGFPMDTPSTRAAVQDHAMIGVLDAFEAYDEAGEPLGIVRIDGFPTNTFERGVEGYRFEEDLNVHI